MDDDVDARECSSRLSEQAMNVEVVGEVGANGDDRAIRGQDVRERRFGSALMLEIDDDDCPAPARQRARDLAAGSRRAFRDDRHHIRAETFRVPIIVGIADHPLLLLVQPHEKVDARARSRPRSGAENGASG